MAADTPHIAARTAAPAPAEAIKAPSDSTTHGMTPTDAGHLSNHANSLDKPTPKPDLAAQNALANPGNFIDGVEDKGKTISKNASTAVENTAKSVETAAVSGLKSAEAAVAGGIKGAEAAAANGAKAVEGAAETFGKAAGAAAGDALTAVGNAIITPAKADQWVDDSGNIYSGDRDGTYVSSNGDIDTRVAGGHVNSRGFTPDR